METLHGAAIVAEKLWYRTTANLYLLACLDYTIRRNDEVAILRQLIFIGEMMVRRRDFELALMFYFFALERLCEHANDRKRPSFSSVFFGRIYENIGDVLLAYTGIEEKFSGRLNKMDNEIKNSRIMEETYNRLKGMPSNLNSSVDSLNDLKTLPRLDDPTGWYEYSAKLYLQGGRKRYRFDVIAKQLRYCLWSLATEKAREKRIVTIESFWRHSKECYEIVIKPVQTDHEVHRIHFVETTVVDRRRFAELLCLWGQFYQILAERSVYEPNVQTKDILRRQIKEILEPEIPWNIQKNSEEAKNRYFLDDREKHRFEARERQHPLWRYASSKGFPPFLKHFPLDGYIAENVKQAPKYAELFFLISNQYFLETIEDHRSVEANLNLGKCYSFVLTKLLPKLNAQETAIDAMELMGRLWVAAYQYFKKAQQILLSQQQQSRRNALRVFEISEQFLLLYENKLFENFLEWADTRQLSTLDSEFSVHRLLLQKDVVTRLKQKMKNRLEESKRQHFRVPIDFIAIHSNVLDRDTHFEVCVAAKLQEELFPREQEEAR
ncbi:MAG: hypothetical protein JXX14_21185 [Deltaproteobacteria bacterium]|nr:hypothetical protein [Deltaproteobacteria bacterium]